jgi:Fe-S-cluster containining protein
MDREYRTAALHYNFNCNACADNCCQTRFYHHTYIEYLLVQEGFQTLDPAGQAEIESGARNVIQRTADLDKIGKPVRLMCPLNLDDLCVVYPYRPMICRLHGIPHEFRSGAGQRVQGPGCETFDERCSANPYLKFDRTPFYREMAGLEKEFRQTLGVQGKIRMTIAEMINSIARSAKVMA